MNTKTQQGFIPLVAIIAIGIAIIAGGTAITLSLKSEPEKDQNTAVQATVEATTSPKEAISSQVKTPAITEVKPSPKDIQVIPEEPSKSVTLDTEALKICDTISKEKIDTSKRSLIEDMRVLCELIQKGRYQGEELDRALEILGEKWQLWLVVQAEYQKREDRLERDPR